MYAYVHGHTRTRGLSDQQKNKQGETRGQPRTVVGPRPLKINCSNALNFMTSTDAIAAKNAFCFDHELVRDQSKILGLRLNYMITILLE